MIVRLAQLAQRPDNGGPEAPVKQQRLEVPEVGEPGHQGHRVHRPVEAQRARAEQHAETGGRQVEEGQPPGQARRMTGHRVVGAGELGRPAAAHAQPAQRYDGQAAGDQGRRGPAALHLRDRGDRALG